jgi:hypothetical protein
MFKSFLKQKNKLTNTNNQKNSIINIAFKTFTNNSKSNFNKGISKDSTSKDSSESYPDRKFKEKFKTKVQLQKRTELLKKEMVSNPEFFKAFPHLANKVIDETNIDEDDNLKQHIDENYFIKDSDKDQNVLQKKTNYFESLL